jgi:ABC-type Fe3+-hydroxamate transport system substrate-binding protein
MPTVNIASLRPVIDARSVALHEALSKLFKRNETVAIYGAPAKLTTLLYATGLQDLPFACVGDDNPRKVGRTTPGNHIPIVSVEEMLARKPDTILVASWNFFDDLRRKLRAAGFKGGIINPMNDRETG